MAIIGTLPNNLVDGQVADAVPVMADFNFIVSQVNANAAAQSTTPTIAQLQAGNFTLLTGVTGTDTITGSSVPALTSYSAGNVFVFVSAGRNATSTPTLNVNGLGAKNLTAIGAQALRIGDIPPSATVVVAYDGTQFQIVSVYSKRNQVVNTQQYFDVGGITSNTSLSNIQTSGFNYTPVSSSSYLNICWYFEGAEGNLNAVNTVAGFQGYETTGAATALGTAYQLAAPSGGGNTGIQAPCSLMVNGVTNNATTTRTFNLFVSTNNASVQASATNIRCVIQEVSNV